MNDLRKATALPVAEPTKAPKTGYADGVASGGSYRPGWTEKNIPTILPIYRFVGGQKPQPVARPRSYVDWAIAEFGE